MKMPDWLKPGLYGAICGAVALAIIGFTAGGWVTAKEAQRVASSEAREQVIAALVPICIDQSQTDPKLDATMARLKDAENYKRSDLLMETGWATMPGAENPNRSVAIACMDQLAKQF